MSFLEILLYISLCIYSIIWSYESIENNDLQDNEVRSDLLSGCEIDDCSSDYLIQSNDHTLICGFLYEKEDVLYYEKFSIRGEPDRIVKKIKYPNKNIKSSKTCITLIFVHDLTRDGTNGHVKVVDGGVGYNFVKLEFRSPKTYNNISFEVIIIGH